LVFAVTVLFVLGSSTLPLPIYQVHSSWNGNGCTGNPDHIDALLTTNESCNAISCVATDDFSYNQECITGTPDIPVPTYILQAVSNITNGNNCSGDPIAITGYLADTCAGEGSLFTKLSCSGTGNITGPSNCPNSSCIGCQFENVYTIGCNPDHVNCYTGCTSTTNQCYTPSGSPVTTASSTTTSTGMSTSTTMNSPSTATSANVWLLTMILASFVLFI